MIIDRQIIDNNGKRSVIELIVINDGRNDNFYIRNTASKSERFAGNTIPSNAKPKWLSFDDIKNLREKLKCLNEIN